MDDEEFQRLSQLEDVFAFGTVEQVQALLAGDIDLSAPMLMGVTPLIAAVKFSNYALVEYLIRLGVDVNLCYRDLGSEPAVKIAYDHGDTRMYELLLAAGADISQPGWIGISVVDRMRDA